MQIPLANIHWRFLLVRDDWGFQVNPLCRHDITSPFPPSGNEGYVRNRDVLYSAGKLIRYLHGSYFLPYHNTVSTPDTSGAALQNTIELIIISDAVYTGWDTTRQILNSKLLPRSIYDVLT